MRLFFLDLGVGKRHPGLKIGNTQVQAGLEPTSHHIHVTGSRSGTPWQTTTRNLKLWPQPYNLTNCRDDDQFIAWVTPNIFLQRSTSSITSLASDLAYDDQSVSLVGVALQTGTYGANASKPTSSSTYNEGSINASLTLLRNDAPTASDAVSISPELGRPSSTFVAIIGSAFPSRMARGVLHPHLDSSRALHALYLDVRRRAGSSHWPAPISSCQPSERARSQFAHKPDGTACLAFEPSLQATPCLGPPKLMIPRALHMIVHRQAPMDPLRRLAVKAPANDLGGRSSS